MKKSPIKKAVLLTLFLLLIVLCSCGNQYYSPVEDFSYEFIEGTVTIVLISPKMKEQLKSQAIMAQIWILLFQTKLRKDP